MPFLGLVGLFLLLPTVIIAAGSFTTKSGSFTFSNLTAINQPYLVKSLVNSLVISAVSAVVGALAGALIAYAGVTGNPRGVLLRSGASPSGVLAQVRGVTLAFAFIAPLRPTRGAFP